MTINIRAPKKKVVMALTAVIVMLIALVGTFAWSSLNQSRINVLREVIRPNVNLHDDFEGGPNKDVYVENSGDVPVYIRVMLSEFLRTDNRNSLVAMSRFGDGEGEDQLQAARDTWYPHNGIRHSGSGPAAHLCYIEETLGDMWPHGTNFHDYYEWVMGGADRWIYYKPATPEQRGVGDDGNPLQQKDADGNPLFDSEGQPVYVIPTVVADPLTAEKGDAAAWYQSEVERLMETGLTEAEAMEQLGVKKTLETQKVITMAEWKSVGFSKGNFWVVDIDGWCYWANPLQPGDATGLLLDEVKRTGTLFDSNAEYAINVWLQAVDESEFIDTLSGSGGGITNDARLLLHFAAGNLLSDKDNNLYKKNRDGTYIEVYNTTDTDEVLGEPKADAKDFVLLGATDITSSMKVSADNKFEIGAYFTITDLAWDGEDYEKWEDDGGSALPWNITVLDNLTGTEVKTENNPTKLVTTTGGAQVYQLTGVTYGVDSLMYLKMAPLTKPGDTDTSEDYSPDHTETQYIGSAKKNGDGSYSQLNPGYGPYVFIYPANAGGAIGTAKDMRGDPRVDLGTRYFYHIGNGVYVETDSKAGTSAINSTYYFAGQLLTKTTVSGANGDGDGKIPYLFPLILNAGDPIDVAFDTDENGVQRVNDAKGEGMGYAKDTTTDDEGKYTALYTFDIVTGTNGQLYIYLGSPENGYIGIGNLYDSGQSKFLGTVGSDTRVWAGSNGIGTSGDSAKQPDLFGQGTAADPFKVSSEKELIYIAQQVALGNTFTGVYFTVTKDIDLADFQGDAQYPNFQRIGYRNRPFRGIFDGGGNVISNLTVNAGSDECYALFGWLEGTVKNVTMTGVNITGNYQCYAGIAGHTNGNALIENCEVSGTITGGTTGHTGGIAGYIMGNTKIIGCKNNINITVRGSYGGGIVGYINGSGNTVENGTNTGNINLSGGNYHGGIVGFNNGGAVKNCTNSGKLLGTTGQYIGGIVGETYGPVTDCTNEGQIGDAGNRRSHSGGIIGVNYATVQNCVNKAPVYGTSYVGGVVGLQNRNTAKIIGSSNTAVVNGNGTHAGGVVGYIVAGSLVENCFSTGDVTGVNNTGGLVGSNYGIVQTSYVTGGMTATGNFNGGLIGFNYSGATMTRCYFDGTKNNKLVKGGTNYTGGITGVQQGTVTNCYAWGGVSGINYVGGVSGYNNGTYATSYHDKGTVTGTSYVGGAIGVLQSGTATLIEAMTTKVGGTSDFVGRVFGRHVGGTFTSSFYASTNAAISGASNGSDGNGTVLRPTSANPWTGGDYHVSKNIWFYNAQDQLVLKGIGPNGS